MVKTPSLSVIIPLYGHFDLARASLSVQSILSQKGIDYEVIVSEEGKIPRFPKIEGVKYIFHYHKPRPNLSDFNPGRIRNRVITHTNGEFVYTNDADIVFLEQDYLARCVEEMRANPNTVLYRPFMRRLPVDEFVQFKKIARKFGTAMAVKSLDLSQEYIATLNGKLRKLRVFKKKSIYPKTFTAFEEDFQVYVSDEKNRGREPLFWNENRHCGGNLFRMEQFIAVGGYSEDFINWGCEDSDLQWKFSQLYDLHFFPEDLEVLHLDHPKGYFSPEMWVRNEKINKKRVKEGIEKVIERDRRNIIWMQP